MPESGNTKIFGIRIIHIFSMFTICFIGAKINETYKTDPINFIIFGAVISSVIYFYMFMTKLMDTADKVTVAAVQANVVMNNLNNGIEHLANIQQKGIAINSYMQYLQMFMPMIMKFIETWGNTTPNNITPRRVIHRRPSFNLDDLDNVEKTNIDYLTKIQYYIKDTTKIIKLVDIIRTSKHFDQNKLTIEHLMDIIKKDPEIISKLSSCIINDTQIDEESSSDNYPIED